MPFLKQESAVDWVTVFLFDTIVNPRASRASNLLKTVTKITEIRSLIFEEANWHYTTCNFQWCCHFTTTGSPTGYTILRRISSHTRRATEEHKTWCYAPLQELLLNKLCFATNLGHDIFMRQPFYRSHTPKLTVSIRGRTGTTYVPFDSPTKIVVPASSCSECSHTPRREEWRLRWISSKSRQSRMFSARLINQLSCFNRRKWAKGG